MEASSDRHDHGRRVIPSGAFDRFADEMQGGECSLGALGENFGQLVVVEGVGNAVGADEEAVSGPAWGFTHLRVDELIPRAEGFLEAVLGGV